jgi:ankyrin repeat protein
MRRLAAFAIFLTLAACTAVPPSPLAGAAREGNLDGIRRLAQSAANLNEPSGVNSWTPLHHAIHKNQPGSVSMLLELGADVNARSPHGVTPLMMAAGYGYDPIVRILLDHHADPALEGCPRRDRIGLCKTSRDRHRPLDMARATDGLRRASGSRRPALIAAVPEESGSAAPASSIEWPFPGGTPHD